MSKQRIALVCIALHTVAGRINLKPGEVLPDNISARQLAELERLKAFREADASSSAASTSAESGRVPNLGNVGGATGLDTNTTGESGKGSDGGGASSPSATGTPLPALTGDSTDGLTNLNTADAAALRDAGMTAPQAAKFIDWRAGLGRPLASVSELADAPGIGAPTVAKISDRVTV